MNIYKYHRGLGDRVSDSITDLLPPRSASSGTGKGTLETEERRDSEPCPQCRLWDQGGLGQRPWELLSFPARSLSLWGICLSCSSQGALGVGASHLGASLAHFSLLSFVCCFSSCPEPCFLQTVLLSSHLAHPWLPVSPGAQAWLPYSDAWSPPQPRVPLPFLPQPPLTSLWALLSCSHYFSSLTLIFSTLDFSPISSCLPWLSTAFSCLVPLCPAQPVLSESSSCLALLTFLTLVSLSVLL